MAERIRKSGRLHEAGPVALGELMHAQVRVTMASVISKRLRPTA